MVTRAALLRLLGVLKTNPESIAAYAAAASKMCSSSSGTNRDSSNLGPSASDDSAVSAITAATIADLVSLKNMPDPTPIVYSTSSWRFLMSMAATAGQSDLLAALVYSFSLSLAHSLSI